MRRLRSRQQRRDGEMKTVAAGGGGKAKRGELKGTEAREGNPSEIPLLGLSPLLDYVSPPLTPAFKPPVWVPLELSWKLGGKQDRARRVVLREGRREKEPSGVFPFKTDCSDYTVEEASGCSVNSVPQFPLDLLHPSQPPPPLSLPQSPCKISGSSPKSLARVSLSVPEMPV